MDRERTRLDLLRPVADALRAALKDMDDESVPAVLRPLVDTSARRLPGPLVRRALTELDRSGWLRDEVEARDGLDPDSPAGLFVGRPEGWENRLDALVEEAISQQARREAAASEERLASALQRVAELEGRVEDLREEVAQARQQAGENIEQRVGGIEASRRRLESRATHLGRELESAADREKELAGRLSEAEARIEVLRQRLQRQARAGDTATPASAPRRGWFPSDPLEMADELDRIVTAVERPPRSTAPAGDRGDRRPIRIPAGIRPDGGAAIRFLLGHRLTWLIDGYNVAFHLGAGAGPAGRDGVLAGASRLVAAGRGRASVLVAFDSSVDETSAAADRRVSVVFVPSADDWILSRAEAGHVVVSSDRRVREGADESGAIGIWSEAFAEWLAADRPAS